MKVKSEIVREGGEEERKTLRQSERMDVLREAKRYKERKRERDRRTEEHEDGQR